jgi:tetratricopeptide (TPR) repeat protein
LLQHQEREFLGKLSVFRGGFTREAAGQIGANGRPAATLPLLSTLVSKSLLQRGGNGRYQLHELLRQFAAEKLSVQSHNGDHSGDFSSGNGTNQPDLAIRNAHSLYYLNRVAAREKDLNGRKQQSALQELETEIENIREAWRWAVHMCQEEAIAQAQNGLANLFWAENWLQEGAELFAQAAIVFKENQVDNTLLIAQLETREAGYRAIVGESERANQILEGTLAVFRQLEAADDEANVLGWLGTVESRKGRLQEALVYHTQALEIYRRLENVNGMATALFQLGFIANERGEYDRAETLQTEALALRRQTGNLTGIVGVLSNLGFISYRKGSLEDARVYAEESLALNQLLGNQAGIATATRQLGMVASLRGDYQEAFEKYKETLNVNKALANYGAMANSYINLSHITTLMGDYAAASEYANEICSIAGKTNNRWAMMYGRNNLGHAVLNLGRYDEARQHLYEALQIEAEMRAIPVALETLTGIIQLMIHDGQSERALEILFKIMDHPALIPETKELITRPYDQLIAELPANIVAAAQSRAQERPIESYLDELINN